MTKAIAHAGTSSIGARLRRIGLTSYKDYLASERWTSMRKRWYASPQYKGAVCSTVDCDTKHGLALHHMTYERLGKEDVADLVLVCADCHKTIHMIEKTGVPLLEATRKVLGREVTIFRDKPKPAAYTPKPKVKKARPVKVKAPTPERKIPYAIQKARALLDIIEGLDNFGHVESAVTGIKLRDNEAYVIFSRAVDDYYPK